MPILLPKKIFYFKKKIWKVENYNKKLNYKKLFCLNIGHLYGKMTYTFLNSYIKKFNVFERYKND